MTREEIQKKVIDMLAERTDKKPQDIKLEHKLNVDIVLDSLSYAELLMECEESFDIEIPMEEAGRFTTVACIIDYLESKAQPSGVA